MGVGVNWSYRGGLCGVKWCLEVVFRVGVWGYCRGEGRAEGAQGG